MVRFQDDPEIELAAVDGSPASQAGTQHENFRQQATGSPRRTARSSRLSMAASRASTSRRESMALLVEGLKGAELSPQTKRFAIRAGVVASIGGLHAGFDIGSTAAVLLPVKSYFDWDAEGVELFVTFMNAGMFVGALIAGVIVDKLGRKVTIMVSGCVFLVASIIVATAQKENAWMLFSGRFAIGMGISFSLIADTLYLAEVSPAEWRGALTSCNELMVAVGILFAFACGLVSPSWRFTLTVPAILAVVQLLLMASMPRSPRWLLQKGFRDEAVEVLSVIFCTKEEQDEAIRAIQMDIWQSEGEFSDLVKNYLPELTTAVTIVTLGQLVGNAPIMSYSPEIFARAGMEESMSEHMTVVLGVTKVISTIVAIWKVDTVGRRMILLTGTLGICMSLASLALSFQVTNAALAIGGCIGFVAFWSPSFGTISLLLPSEIFPTAHRGRAMAVAVPLSSLGQIFVNGTFLTLFNNIGPSSTFLLLLSIGMGSVLFVSAALPETAGLEAHQIHEKFQEVKLLQCCRSSARTSEIPAAVT